MKNKEKILVTGGAGYIGSVLVDFLLQKKYRVTVVDNFLYKQTSLMHLADDPNLEIINMDLSSLKNHSKFYNQFTYIMPLAAIVGAPACSKKPELSNIINNDVIIKMLKVLKPKVRIIMPTTNSAYGTGDANNFSDENSKLKPISKYARDKVIIEKKLLRHKNSISFRLATVFGASPRMRTDLLVNDFVLRATKDKYIVLFEGKFKRNYIHIKDVARVFLHAIKNFSKMRGNIYNVGLDSANFSKIELCDKIKKYIPNLYVTESQINKDPDQRNYIVSNKKLIKTGFKTNYSLDYGITELIKAYTMINSSNFNNL